MAWAPGMVQAPWTKSSLAQEREKEVGEQASEIPWWGQVRES